MDAPGAVGVTMRQNDGAVNTYHLNQGASIMRNHKLIAIDLAKNVFQVCCMQHRHQVGINKSLKRLELVEFMAQQAPTNVAMEACYSSHYWARCFKAMGHTVKLLPAQHVTPFVRGNKSDRNDALAIAEASQRPNLQPVPIKSEEQQDIQALHRLRERHVSNRTALMNQMRGLLSEYGIIAPLGLKAFCALLQAISDPDYRSLTPLFKTQVNQVSDEYYQLTDNIGKIDTLLAGVAKHNSLCRILMSIPGIGVINATALYSAIGNGNQFRNARELAVWLGLTPRQSGSGDKQNSGGITKRGNRYLRKQLVHGARSALLASKKKTDSLSLWANQVAARRGFNKACVALASRLARIAWVLLQRQESYVAL